MSASNESATLNCAQCNAALQPHLKFCLKCGQPTRLCANCRAPNRANSKFCLKCGARFEPVAPVAPPVTATTPSAFLPTPRLIEPQNSLPPVQPTAVPIEASSSAAPTAASTTPPVFLPTPRSSTPPNRSTAMPIETPSSATPSAPATLTQRFFPQPTILLPPVAVDEVVRLVADIKNGNNDQRLAAIDRLRALKPREAVPHLLKMAEGNPWTDTERRAAAIAALGAVGDPSAVPGLLRLKWTIVGLESVICMAVAEIADPSALPYLMEKSWKSLELPARAFATIGLAALRRPEAVPILIAKIPLEHGTHSDSSTSSGGSAMPFVLSVTGHSRAAANWGKLELAGEVVGAVISMFMARKTITQNSFALVDPTIDLNTAVTAPYDIAMLWMLRLKLAALAEIVASTGPAPVMAYRPQCKKPIEHLIAALALLRVGALDAQVFTVLGTASTSKDIHERLLAYEGFLALARTTYASDALQYVTRGLRDQDTRVRAAVGAAIIFTRTVELWPQAVALARDSSADVRMSILPPLALVAASDEQTCDLIANLAATDPERGVRERAADILKTLAL